MLIKAKTFLGTCVSLGDGDAIQDMVHHSRSITLATFRKKIGSEAYWELSDVLGYDRALPGLT
jgi:hypothetical protein